MRKKVILGAIGILILGVAFIFYSYGWFLGKQERVLTGTARPEFPYNDYTIEEMNKMYPQEIDYNAIATVQTPEETYAKLKEYSLQEDITSMTSLFTEKHKKEYEEFFKEEKSNGKLKNLASELMEIKKESCLDSRCIYVEKENVEYRIFFIKTSQGIWLIDSL
ncbi:MAG: hypothetical protein PHY40_03490 [Patescibacteria group bacterium]|nr:hypothetical protein [Patescibacteria group bacterium]